MVIGIMALVITSVGGYFVNNLRNYNADRDQLAAQEAVERAMKALVETAMEAQAITTVDLAQRLDITLIDGAAVPQTSRYTLSDTNDLLRSINGGAAETTASNIQSVVLRPFKDPGGNASPVVITTPTAADYTAGSTCGLEITVTAVVNQRQVTLTDNIYFRNR